MLPTNDASSTNKEIPNDISQYNKTQVFNLNTRFPYFIKEQGDYFGKHVFLSLQKFTDYRFNHYFHTFS